ncbi:hypothetical protein JCM8547_000574 [Rhodosporidiobolus lusitaniae]
MMLTADPPPPHLTPLASPVPSPPRSVSPTRSSLDRSHQLRPASAGAASRPISPAIASLALEAEELFETEVFGHLKVTVVEAKDLAVSEERLSKPYVLLQYDRTLSVSREWGAPPASSAPEGEKKSGMLRHGAASKRGTTTRRVVGGPTSSSASSSASTSPTSLSAFSAHSSSSRTSTDPISSLHSVSLPSSPSKYRPDETLRPISSSAPSLPASIIGTPQNPIWNHEATFDVVAPSRTILVCVYDKLAPQGGPPTRSHGFAGACVFEPPLLEDGKEYAGEDGKGLDVWVPLTSALDPTIGGEIRLRLQFEPLLSRPKLSISDFQLLRLIGQGSFGQVFRVRKRDTKRIYALKVIRKANVGDDPRAIKQVWTERKVLEGNNLSPFLCGLKFGFQNESCFFFCLDYKAGGELFQHMQRDGGRFDEAKVRFYIAEIVLALGFLHARGIVYRDLKPENCLLDGSGHVVLCDFGLSKILENEPGQKTNTLCGTTSFLAPEVLLDEGYSYPSDFWSLGVLLFEMCFGWSPFYSENRLTEYENILNAEIKIPAKKGYSEEVKDLLKQLLTRDVPSRLGSTNGVSDIQSHPFFTPIDWPRLALKQVSPPYKPPTHADDDAPDYYDTGRQWRFDLDAGCWGGGGEERRSCAGRMSGAPNPAECSLTRAFSYRHKDHPQGKWWDRKAAELWGKRGKGVASGGGGEGGVEREGEGEWEGEQEVERYRERGMDAGTRRSSFQSERMSSQKDIKPDLSKQQTLFSFFSKPASSSSSSSQPQPASSSPSVSRSSAATNGKGKQAAVKTPLGSRKSSAGGSSAVKSSGGTTATTAGKAKSTPATSEGGGEVVMMLESSDVEVEDVKPKIPAKRAVKQEDDDEGESEEEEVGASRRMRKRPSLMKPKVEDSEEEDEDEDDGVPVGKKKAPVKPAAKGKATNGKAKKGKTSRDDDDDFEASSASGGDDDSDDYSDPGLDDIIAGMSDPESDASSSSSTVGQKKKKSTKKAAPAAAKKSSPAQSRLAGFAAGAGGGGGGVTGGVARPQLKTNGSGSGGIGAIKTKAESQREQAKKDKQANEEVFSFLIDPKDIDGIRPNEPGYDPRTLYIPKSAWNEFTPFERQFWEIKQMHYDTVLFFQKGKFFELYEEDAAIGHREFDLKLTDRVKMKMVGVPESSFDFWAAKFLAQGYKVGRVDQCETALGAEIRNKDDKAAGGKGKSGAKQKNGKEIVRRELKSVLTGGTIVEGDMLTDDMSNHCVAIKEDTPTPSSPPSFGISVLDASTAEFQLSHFTDDACRTELETLMRQLKPKEVIHQKGNLSVATLRLLRSCLGIECQWTALKEGREFLRPEDAREEVEKLFRESKGGEGEEMEVDGEAGEGAEVVPENIRKMFDKPVAMSALGGMIWYLRQLNLDADLVTTKNFNIYDPLSRSSGTLALDGQTLAHIEVLQNSQGTTEGTLLQLLSRCGTPFGKRLFKVWLCAPLRDVQGINDRLDAVEDLLSNSNFAVAFDSMAKKLPDLERLLSRIHSKTIKKADFLRVVTAFEQIDATVGTLKELCEDFKSRGIPELLEGSPEVEGLLEEMRGMWDSDELLPVEGKDEEYEALRQGCEDVEEELEAELKKARKQFGDKSIGWKDIGTKDIMQIEVPVKHKAPSNWTKMSQTKAVNRYYTPETTVLINNLKEARERKTMYVNTFQFKLYGEFDKHYSTWMSVIKTVAQLDCLLSLSKSSAALGEPCVRPEIVESDQAILEFEELRHPCILSASSDFIPNDVSLGGDNKNMMLLTGPNMAGKSTLLRMTCTAVIMAQLGCFVPAAKARVAPVDAIYSRMGANDAIFASASTFKVEMDDCNKILQKSTPRSLVILDELGRGTSTYDGMAIAFAVLHRLATHTGCVGFFATHFTSLTEDYAYHPQIRLANMQTSVNDATREVVFLYKLIDGSAPKSYGPHVASMAGLSEAIVERAIGISKQFEETSRARERAMRANETLPLTAQADAAFLLKLAQLKIDGGKYDGDKAQLRRTLKTMRRAVEAMKGVKAAGVVAATA